MVLADLIRKLVKLTDEDKISWNERPGGYTSNNNNYSITVIRQLNSFAIPVRTEITFVSGDSLTKTPTTFNLCDYDYNSIRESIIRSHLRMKNSVEISQLNHADRVITGIVKQ